MGSFNTTCALTGEVISSGTPAVMVMITKTNKKRPLHTNSWDAYSPTPILFEGQYDGYGRLKDVTLFQSMNVLEPHQIEMANDYIFNSLKNNTNAAFNNPSSKNIAELMQTDDWSFVSKDTTAMILESLLELATKTNPQNPMQIFDNSQYKQLFGSFNSIDEIESKIKVLKEQSKSKLNLIQFVYFEKLAFIQLVNQYGLTNKDPDPDIYAQIIQHNRKNAEPPHSETRCIMLGEQNFAGSNYPVFYLTKELKEQVKEVLNRETVRKLENLQIQDMTLVNDYFSMLGKSWSPSMTIHEDIKSYGHDEALEFQKILLADNNPKKYKP